MQTHTLSHTQTHTHTHTHTPGSLRGALFSGTEGFLWFLNGPVRGINLHASDKQAEHPGFMPLSDPRLCALAPAQRMMGEIPRRKRSGTRKGAPSEAGCCLVSS